MLGPMSKSTKPVPEIVQAAETLEGELVRLETLARAAQKHRLDSEKNITRAAKELADALALPERLASGLRSLGVAMQQMEARQQAALQPLATFASEIQARMQKLAEHMKAFAALGQAAAEATALLQAGGERTALLEGAKAQLNRIADDARILFEAAHADDFPEVAREAEALKQRVTALTRKLEGASPPN
jgi:cysteinyl-tRNA synthetase